MIDFLYDLCYMFPLNLVVTLSFLTYGGMREFSLAGCIVSSASIVFIRALRHAGKKERFLIGGIVTVALLGIFWGLGKEKRAELVLKYNFMLWIIVVSVLCIIVGRLSRDYLWAKLIATAALTGNLIYLMIYRIDISKVAVAGSFLVMMVYLASVIQKYWDKSGYTDIKKHISLLTPVMLLVFLLVCLMPAPSETFDWSFAKSLWNSIVTEYRRFSGIFAGGDDDYAFAGFNSDGTFAGGIGKSDKEVMLISTDSKTIDRLYMGGAVFENFSATGWTSDLEKEDNYRQFDILETRGAIIRYSQGYERDFIHEDIITVVSRQNNSVHVFTPTKVNLDSSKSSLKEYKETAESIVTNDKIRYGDTYTLDGYSLNLSNEELIRLIDDAEPLQEDEWNELLRKAAVSDREDCSFSNYQAYKTSIYDIYGAANGLSEDATELVARITQGTEGDFGRVKALSDYLQTMTYNTEPGAIPDYVTDATGYLDYFLFESKSGYCVHYATALVLLARECGYPARYVQGYYIVKDRDAVSTMVTSQSAHSWAEIYFDNFGWVAFEATPGYGVSAGWNVEKYIKPAAQTGYSQYNQNNGEAEEETVPEIIEEEEKHAFPVKLFVIPLLMAIIFGAVYILINRLISVHRYQKMQNDEKLRFLTGRNLRILKLMGYPITDGETIDEFRTRVEEESDGEIASFEYIEIYEKLLYSDYTVTDRDVEIAVLDYETLKRTIRRSGTRYYFYFL